MSSPVDKRDNMSEKSTEKNVIVHAQERQVDEAARFSLGRDVTPEEALAVRKKIDRHILPLMCGTSSKRLVMRLSSRYS